MQTFLVLSLLVEATIETYEMVVKDFDYKLVLAFALGAVGAWLFGANLFTLLDVSVTVEGIAIQIANSFIVGVLVVRYAGAGNSLINFVKKLSK